MSRQLLLCSEALSNSHRFLEATNWILSTSKRSPCTTEPIRSAVTCAASTERRCASNLTRAVQPAPCRTRSRCGRLCLRPIPSASSEGALSTISSTTRRRSARMIAQYPGERERERERKADSGLHASPQSGSGVPVQFEPARLIVVRHRDSPGGVNEEKCAGSEGGAARPNLSLLRKKSLCNNMLKQLHNACCPRAITLVSWACFFAFAAVLVIMSPSVTNFGNNRPPLSPSAVDQQSLPLASLSGLVRAAD